MQLPEDNKLILVDDKAILKLDIDGLVQECSNSICLHTGVTAVLH